MYSAEPLPHFVDEYLAYLYEVHPTNATFDGVHLHDDLLEDLGRPAIDTQVRELGAFRPAAGRHRPGAPDRHRAAGAAGARGEYPGAALRARGDPDLGAQPAALLRHSRDQPGRPGAVRVRAAHRARAAHRLEAAPGAAADAGGPRQHQGPARHLREGRSREPARHAAVHQRRPAARVQPARRHAHPRRSRGRLDRGGLRHRALHRVSREGDRAEDQGLVPPGPGQVRAEAAPRRGGHARLGSTARPRDARAAQHAGGVPPGGVADERRRSARRVGESQGGSPGGRGARSGGAAAAPGAVRLHSAQRHHHDPGRRTGFGGADAPLLPLDVREHVDAGAIRDQAGPRVLLHHRRRSVMAGRAPGRAPARLQLRGALGDLDPRSVPRALPALPAPAPGLRRNCASRSSSRRRPSSKAGRTTASR